MITRTRRMLALVAFFIAIPFFLRFAPDALGLVAFQGTYSEGVRVGQLVKLSERGMLWKTWEVSLGVTQSGAYVERWDFSLDRSSPQHDALLAKLQEAQRTGAIVAVHYRQHYGVQRWHGKTSYFVEALTAR